MNIEMALKSGSYILVLDRVKLTLGIFFYELFYKEFFHQLSGFTFIFVKNKHQKAANLMFGLILIVGVIPAWFLEGQYMLADHHLISYRVSFLAGAPLNSLST